MQMPTCPVSDGELLAETKALSPQTLFLRWSKIEVLDDSFPQGIAVLGIEYETNLMPFNQLAEVSIVARNHRGAEASCFPQETS